MTKEERAALNALIRRYGVETILVVIKEICKDRKNFWDFMHTTADNTQIHKL